MQGTDIVAEGRTVPVLRVARLERDKRVAAEKLAAGAGPRRPFDDTLERAMAFFADRR